MKLTPFYCYNYDGRIHIDFLYDTKLNVVVRLIDYRVNGRQEITFKSLEESKEHDVGSNIRKILARAFRKAKNFQEMEQGLLYNDYEKMLLKYLKENPGQNKLTKLKQELKISNTMLNKAVDRLSVHDWIRQATEFVWYNENRQPYSHRALF